MSWEDSLFIVNHYQGYIHNRAIHSDHPVKIFEFYTNARGHSHFEWKKMPHAYLQMQKKKNLKKHQSRCQPLACLHYACRICMHAQPCGQCAGSRMYVSMQNVSLGASHVHACHYACRICMHACTPRGRSSAKPGHI